MSLVADTMLSTDSVAEPLQVRKMGLGDINTLCGLFCQSVNDSFVYFPEAYRAKMCRQHNIARLLKAWMSPRAHFLLLTAGRQDIGYCLLRFQQNRAYIFWMYVDPNFRGIGAGKKLLMSAIEQSRRSNMEALELVTHDKERFYAKHGFTPLRHVAGLVGGVDMVIMEYLLIK